MFCNKMIKRAGSMFPRRFKFTVENRGNDYIYLVPKVKQEYSLIWLHGLGDSAKGFKNVFEDSRCVNIPKNCKVILPTAPMREVKLNNDNCMTSWYDIMSTDRPPMGLDEHFFAVQYSQSEMSESTDTVIALIEEEIKTVGDASKVFVGGFS